MQKTELQNAQIQSATNEKGVSEEEWRDLPVTLHCETLARLFDTNVRYIQNHAEELGGVKLGKRWAFAKPKVAAMLGLA